MKILNTIGPQFDPEAKKILEQTGEVLYRVLSQTELKDKIGDYEVLVIGLGLRLDKHIIDAASRLKLIATATTGLDHIDVDYAKNKGITVLSLQAEDLKEVTGTAELAFGLLFSIVRRIPESFEDVKQNNWNREKFLGSNLYGKTLGIVGLGRLGSAMAHYGKAFRMNVIAHDPNKNISEDAKLVDFETLISESDVISIHAPLSKDTENLFNEQIFRKMKQNAIIINTSRGAIVDEIDLIKALEDKIIAGYATDVLSGETEFRKDSFSHPLVQYSREHNNLIITPHIGGMTEESRAATDIIIAEKVRSYPQI